MKQKLIPSRLKKRSIQDKLLILKVLEKTLFCTISYVNKNQPYALPTGFVLYEDRLYIHASVKSHFIHALVNAQVCITTFLFDGLVLAGSAFNHSVNYRSVVVFSQGNLVEEKADKLKMLERFTNRYVPNRWDELRPTTSEEINATTVVSFNLDSASLKQRSGAPSFPEEDYHPNLWTGVIPTKTSWGKAIPDPKMDSNISYPNYFTKPNIQI